MFYPTTCVGLRYGSPYTKTVSGFSREHDYLRYLPPPEGREYCRTSDQGTYFTVPPRLLPSFNGLFRQPAAVSLLRHRIPHEWGVTEY